MRASAMIAFDPSRSDTGKHEGGGARRAGKGARGDHARSGRARAQAVPEPGEPGRKAEGQAGLHHGRRRRSGAPDRGPARRTFSQDAVLGEEGGAKGSGDAVWIIDPIDGTANFAHRIPHFSISIGFLSGGRPQLGAIGAPMYGEIFRARLGRGAYCNDRRMKVAGTSDINRAIVELGWSVRRPAHAYALLLERVLATGATFMRAGSGALGLAYVADGRTHGYCELHINAWDVAAGLLLVGEAGGWTNDFWAGEALAKGNPVLACTPGLREALVAVTGVGQANEKLRRRIS